MELKSVLSTMTVFTGVFLLSFMACGVSCRSRGSTNNSSDTSVNNYRKGQHQPHRYDLPHHHHNNGHRLKKQQQQPLHRDEPEVDNESNKISLLRSPYLQRQRQHRRQSTLAPVTSTTASNFADTKLTRPSSISSFARHRKSYSGGHNSRRLPEEDYDEDDDYEEDDDVSEGRHAYLMTTDKKKSSREKLTEDEALNQAFEKHMAADGILNLNPDGEVHDVYAYQLPSSLWFVIRYVKRPDGKADKYMNVVDSFTNYLDKLDKDVKTVSLNVKGVETVFRLTTKRGSSS